jgi:hypothetical protein
MTKWIATSCISSRLNVTIIPLPENESAVGVRLQKEAIYSRRSLGWQLFFFHPR